jgi:hypothetical protein
MRIERKRIWVLLFLGIAAVAMVILAGSLPRMELRPGEPFTLDKAPTGTGEDDLDLEEPAVSEFWAKVLLIMWLGMLACVPLGLVLLVVSREARRQALSYLGPLLVLLVILLFPRSETEESAVVEPPPAGELSMQAPVGTPAVFTPDPPQWLSSLTSTTLGIAAAAAIAGALWLVLRRRRPANPLEQLAQEAQLAITALQAGADLRGTILRCYFEMSRVLRKERGITREQAMTPREFESHLGDLGLPQAPIGELTRLFEAVRYGAKIPAKADEHRAISSLSAIIEACRSTS